MRCLHFCGASLRPDRSQELSLFSCGHSRQHQHKLMHVHHVLTRYRTSLAVQIVNVQPQRAVEVWLGLGKSEPDGQDMGRESGGLNDGLD